MYRANHCRNLLRRDGADCKTLLETYLTDGKCPCSGPPRSWCSTGAPLNGESFAGPA
jgi:hypothetical protein